MTDWTPDIELLRQRANEEWLRVERTYCGRLLAYAQRRTQDLQASEDIVQETLLGAVRGIGDFDPEYSFEQYLFGICRNRTIDHMRRKRARTIQVDEEDEEFRGFESYAVGDETPSAIVRGRELSLRAQRLFGDMLRDWVEEAWEAGEYKRLAVVEALFSGGWRNRDTWERFDLRDETAVAGIKFRALKRLRQLAAVRESGGDLLAWLASAEENQERLLDLDVPAIWRERRVSCPARHWLARMAAGTLEPEPTDFLRFHMDELKCPWCQANYDDLAKKDELDAHDPWFDRVQETTRLFLRETDL
ncbi:MAG: sigma-70 family RNA polymerase sigma factor [Planctomycetota bacterium]